MAPGTCRAAYAKRLCSNWNLDFPAHPADRWAYPECWVYYHYADMRVWF